METKVKRVGNYRLGRTLGKGAFGRVKAATQIDSGKSVAIKILRKEEVIKARMSDQVRNEIEVLKKLGKHDNMVQMVDFMASNEKIYIVLELILGGELLYHIASQGFFEEKVAVSYFKQLINGLEYLQSKLVCHRDIKPENLLITESGVLKMTDFGLAVIIDEPEGMVSGMTGTPAFWAPEVTRDSYPGFPPDIWASGVVLYIMLSGVYPFVDSTAEGLIEKIRRLDFKFHERISRQAQDFLSEIFVSTPYARIQLDEIRRHPFLAKAKVPSETPSADPSAVELSPVAKEDIKTLDAFEIIMLSDILNLTPLIGGRPPAITRFLSLLPPSELLKQIMDILCKMTVIFTVIERQATINIQAPFENNMIVIIVQIFKTESPVCITDFKKWKGDEDEFRRIYRAVNEKLGNAVLR